MLKISSKILFVCALFAFVASPVFASGHMKKQGIFTVVTSANTQTQLMAMVLTMTTMKQKKPVRILLCGPAGELAVKGSKETKLKPKNMSPQMLLKKMVAGGVDVKICPLYLPNAGKTTADLIKGVSVAKPPMIAKGLADPKYKLFNF